MCFPTISAVPHLGAGSDVSAETPYAHCASQADGSLLEDELGCTHMLSSLSEAEQAEVAAGCLLFMKAVALDALQQADLTRASRRVNGALPARRSSASLSTGNRVSLPWRHPLLAGECWVPCAVTRR